MSFESQHTAENDSIMFNCMLIKKCIYTISNDDKYKVSNWIPPDLNDKMGVLALTSFLQRVDSNTWLNNIYSDQIQSMVHYVRFEMTSREVMQIVDKLKLYTYTFSPVERQKMYAILQLEVRFSIFDIIRTNNNHFE